MLLSGIVVTPFRKFMQRLLYFVYLPVIFEGRLKRLKKVNESFTSGAQEWAHYRDRNRCLGEAGNSV